MSKDIKICIKGLLVSIFLFALGIFIANNTSFSTFSIFCATFGFLGIILFVIGIILNIQIEYSNKKTRKYYCKLKQEIESKLPKNTQFDVNIANQNNEILNKLLCENLKCTALFDGSTVYINLSLPEELCIGIDDVLWFSENFNY